MTVRLRGIYATALTELLRDEVGVVQASDPIRERFDAEFPAEPAAASVETTGDRQGLVASGDRETVDAVTERVGAVGRDAFVWPAAAPRSAVFDGVVDHTRGGGTVVELADDVEGYLPFENADAYVDEGDSVRVQVVDPAAPWTSKRPLLDTEIRAFGEIATLVRGRDSLVADAPDGRSAQELARTTELLSASVPDDWAVEWGHAAGAASMDALDDALERAAATASTVDEAVTGASDPADRAPGRVVAPGATAFVWFGGDARRALDDVRREVVSTMVGHHRVKAGSEAASTAVDFAESLGSLPEEFPFRAVSEQFGPETGDRVRIDHGKPDGRRFTLGRGDVTDLDADVARVTVEREMTGSGTYDGLGVDREAGDVAVTRFEEGRWWYPTVYRGEDGERRGTYVNVNTPLELFPDSVRYVDLHVDVVKYTDGTTEVVDADELEACVDAGTVTRDLADHALDVAERIENAFAE